MTSVSPPAAARRGFLAPRSHRPPRRKPRVRTPTLLQMEACECGAASLGIILAYHRRFVALEELRQACDITRDGANALSIRKAAESYGLNFNGRKLGSTDVRTLPLPFVAYWENNHFLVVEGFRRETVFLNDPASGPRKVTKEEFERSFSRIYLTFKPGPEFREGGRKRGLVGALKPRLGSAKWALAFVILAGLLLVIPGLVSASFSKVFIDEVLIAGKTDWFKPLALAMLVTVLVRVALIRLQQDALKRVEIGLAMSASVRFLRHALRLPIDFFNQRYAGDVSARVALNNRVSQVISGELATTVVNLLVIVFYAILMVRYSVWITVLGVVLGSVNLLAIRWFSRKRVDENLKVQQTYGKLTANLMWALQIIETIKATGSEADVLARWAGYHARLVNAAQRLGAATGTLLVIPPLVTTLTLAMILGIGGRDVILGGGLSIGMLVALQGLMSGFMQPVNDFVRLGATAQDLEADLNRLDDVHNYRIDPVFDDPPTPRRKPFDDPTRRLSGLVELRHVSFGFRRRDDRPLIEDFNLVLKPGSRIALVGGTGSGKSTIGRLVAGIYLPWSGEILFDGRPRSAYDPTVLTGSLSLVDENIHLFAGTVRENLTLWDPTVPDIHVLRAAQDACIHEDLVVRPGGYEARIAEGARNLSGGQRQRLEIARALVRNPSILILDEATSALDPKTEERVDDHVRRRGCTCLIIAHRLSTIRDCDRILVLQHGKVVEEGTHDELLDRNGPYARLRLGREVVSLGFESDPRPWVAPEVESEAQSEAEAERHLPAAQALTRVLEYEGETIELAGNRPVLLNDPDLIRIVIQGRVDVFLVDVRNIDEVGPRRHLMRVDDGGALFGFAAKRRGDRLGLLAVGDTGTKLFCVRRSKLQQLAAAGLMVEDIADLVDDWIGRLTRSVNDAFPPRAAAEVRREGVLELTDARAARPGNGRGLFWVRHLNGSSLFLGEPELPPLDSSKLFPVDESGWITSIGASRVRFDRTPDIIREEALWTGLDAFHQVALKEAARRRLRDERETADQVRGSLHRERATIARTMNRLGRVLGVRRLGPHVPPEGETLQQACHYIAEALGIVLPPLRGPRSRQSARDPLGRIARAAGLRVRRIGLRGNWHRGEYGPILGCYDEDRRPVALLPTSPGAYELIDTVKDERFPVTPDVVSRLDPYGYTFYRTLSADPQSVSGLLGFGLVGLRRDILSMFGAGILCGLLGLIVPILAGLVVDTAIPTADLTRLNQLCLGIVIVAAGMALFRHLQGLAILRIEGKLVSTLLPAIWDRLLHLPARFFAGFTSGDLALRAMGIDSILRGLSGTAVATILTSSFSFSNILLLFYYNWRMALVACALVGLAIAVTGLILSQLIRHHTSIKAIEGTISSMLLETFTGISKIRVAGAENRAFARWAERYAEQLGLALKARIASNRLVEFYAAYPVLCALVMFALLVSMPAGSMSTGEFLSFFLAFSGFVSAALSLSTAMASIMSLVPTYERLRPILEAMPERAEAGAEPFVLEGEVRLTGVSFRYPDGPLIVDDLDLHVRPGEFVALVGPSGAGKTTLFRLLLGFEAPEEGKVTYDGRDLATLDLREVRRQIGVVLQNAQLMPGDIYSNIVGLSSFHTMDDAREAVRLAGLEDDINAMPMGMHTIVSEGGSTFSGGQRQRLYIARAIVKKPRILLFDEATSALDNRTQAIVARSIDSLQATRIVISHRLSTIMGADRICVIDRGRIVESGTYAELLKQGGLFSELARRQLA